MVEEAFDDMRGSLESGKIGGKRAAQIMEHPALRT